MKRLLLAALSLLALVAVGVVAFFGAAIVRNLLRGGPLEVTGWATGLTWLTVALACVTDLFRKVAKGDPEVLDRNLPGWTALLFPAYIASLIILAVFDWRWAVGLWVTLFVLAFTPALEIVGNLFMGQILGIRFP